MKIVVIGGDARAHAFVQAFARQGHQVVATDSNPGVPGYTITPALELSADLFVISSEKPLVAGLADKLRQQGKRVIGPGVLGAQLEGSKAFMKELVAAAGVLTARYMVVTHNNIDEAEAFIRDELGGVAVVKTDYLAAGKGVLECFTLEEAMADVQHKLQKGEVVVEQHLKGREASAFFLCVCQNGEYDSVAMGSGVDYKKALDGDKGRNTGGIGAFSPAPGVDMEDIRQRFIMPTLAELSRRDIPYIGFLYAGLMVTGDGQYYLLEYNVRFGDPEAEVVLPRITSDLAQVMAEAANGKLISQPTFSNKVAVSVVMSSENYPATPRIGDRIMGLEEARATEGVEGVYCAGVDKDADGNLITAGGRVVAVTGMGQNLAEARAAAYRGVACISWPGEHHRNDIAA